MDDAFYHAVIGVCVCVYGRNLGIYQCSMLFLNESDVLSRMNYVRGSMVNSRKMEIRLFLGNDCVASTFLLKYPVSL